MIVTSAILLLLSTQSLTESHQEFDRLAHQLANHIVWSDEEGSRHLSSRAARIKLKNLSDQSLGGVSQKHFSNWKNNKCYWIFNITSDTKSYRIFFYCERDAKGQSIVTKIKVS